MFNFKDSHTILVKVWTKITEVEATALVSDSSRTDNAQAQFNLAGYSYAPLVKVLSKILQGRRAGTVSGGVRNMIFRRPNQRI